MNRDDVIRMAKQADASFETADSMFRFAALVAAAEREACAKLIENTSLFSSSPKAVFFISHEARREQAAAIRARGQK